MKALISVMPIAPVGGVVEAIVRSGCRGDEYVTAPAWMRTTFFWRALVPEVVEWINRLFIMTGTSPTHTFGQRLLQLTGLKTFIYPPSVLSPAIDLGQKTD